MTAQERQGAVLAYINEFWRRNCYSPSMKEIMAACHVSSTSVVRYTLLDLQEAGRLTYQDGIARSIVPAWVSRRLGGNNA